MAGVMTICPRCRAPHDSRRTSDRVDDPLLLTTGARLCESCAPAVDVTRAEAPAPAAGEHDLAA
jgi:hypothetical protein